MITVENSIFDSDHLFVKEGVSKVRLTDTRRLFLIWK